MENSNKDIGFNQQTNDNNEKILMYKSLNENKKI